MKFEYTDINGNTIQLRTFVFKRSWGELIKPLPDDQAGQLIKAFFRYVDGEPFELEQPLKAILQMMIRELRSSTKHHIEKIKQKERLNASTSNLTEPAPTAPEENTFPAV